MKWFDFKKKGKLPTTVQQAWNDFDSYLQWLIGWNKSGRFISGGDVAELFKGYYGTIYSCIDRRSKGVARTKWRLYTTDTKSPKSKQVTSKQKDYLFSLPSLEKSLSNASDMVEITSDSILDLLQKVNSLHNQSHLKLGTITLADISGDAYWYVEKGAFPFRISFLPPQYMTPIRSTAKDETYGDIVKYIYKRGEEEISYDANEIVHFVYFNPDLSLKGFSPLRAACESVSLDHAMVDFLFDLVANRLRQEMILTSEGQLQEPVRKVIQEQMEEYRMTNKSKMPILPGNLKPIILSQNARDLPFVTNRKLERELICNVFSVPISMLTSESSNRSVQEVSETEFAMYGIQPLCENMQETMNQSFIPMFPNSERKFISFDDPVPKNRELELQERTEYTKSGIRYIDEIRLEMNLEPVGIDYPMINGQRIGESSEEQGKAFAKAVKEEMEKGEK